jgi:hypothetical protein
MYDDQDRPPWLRNLRTARPQQPKMEPYAPAPTVAEPAFEPGITEAPDEGPADVRAAITRRQMLLLALLLWGNVSVLGCLCLLATRVVVP